jgi:mitochondrial enoyl-[acyl-carrier protein] reductase / trans-2-enoyl-CoA reductase
MNSDKVEDYRTLIDYLLGLVHEGKLKYEYVKCRSHIQLLLDVGHRFSHIGAKRAVNLLKHICGMEVSPLGDFSLALKKAMCKHGSHPKQVIRF